VLQQEQDGGQYYHVLTRADRWRAGRREKSIRLPVLSGQAVHGGVGGAGGGQLGGEGEGPARWRHASTGPRVHLSVNLARFCIIPTLLTDSLWKCTVPGS
jgi:hypothetical protein